MEQIHFYEQYRMQMYYKYCAKYSAMDCETVV